MNLNRTLGLALMTISIVTAAFGQSDTEKKIDNSREDKKMYGLFGKIIAVEGRRDALTEILLEGSRQLPGCLSYIIAKDPADSNAIWISEVWESKESHEASLSLPSVQQAIIRGKPLIAGFGERIVTEPVGGRGLTPTEDSSGRR